MKIIISANAAWNLVNFRSNLIKSLIIMGHEVYAVSPEDENSLTLIKLGCQFISIDIDNNGVDPFKDFQLLLTYYKLFRKIRPHVYLGFTIKPNIYGSLAAQLFKIPSINNVSGLGTAFIIETWVTKCVQILYKLAFRGSHCIIFQNPEDRDLFINRQIICINNKSLNPSVQLVPGSGVDLNYFCLHSKNFLIKSEFNFCSSLHTTYTTKRETDFIFLFIGRVIKDKGVVEFVEAAKIIKQKLLNVRFLILGFLDAKNSSAISRIVMDNWVEEGLIEYLGEVSDVRDAIVFSDCVVLPSYREGTPRALLEAAAMERPLIATNVPGCREVIEDGVNGYLCRSQDALDLSLKMLNMIALKSSDREKMGRNGRQKIEREFDEQIVINKYRDLIGLI